MKLSLISLLHCPKCKGSLSLIEAQETEGEIEAGKLECSGCQAIFPIRGFIPRFVQSDNYASSFGFQWQRFQRTQLDSYTGTNISRDRFFRQTDWPAESLAGATVLDAGCGAGRFAEVALSSGAQVIAIDYSEAVDACWRNFALHPKLHVLQADIYALPFQSARFDFIYCFGVLQHTPDPRIALLALPVLLKSGAQLAVDIYMRHWTSMLHLKYWMRPMTSRLPRSTLFQTVERSVPFILPISRALGRLPGIGRALRRLVPVANYEGVQPLNEQQLHEWAVLDTFDWLSPKHDKPQTPATLRSWLVEAGLEDIEVAKVAHLVGRGRRPFVQTASCKNSSVDAAIAVT
ncbi:MAG: methyltransferase domain-containing protein [Acidobacteriota bacterium]